MATAFNNTVQALIAGRRQRSGWIMTAVIIVLGVWLGWLLLAEVGIYKTAPSQLQAERDIHTVEANVDGRVVATHMTVGREVQAGEVLVELENETVRLKLTEHRARLESARVQLRTIEAELAAEQRALTSVLDTTPTAEAERRLRYEQAREAAQLAEEELARWRRLRDSGAGASEMQIVERESAARQRRGAAEELRLAMTRGQLDQRTAEADRRARIERLRRDAAELTGLVAATTEVVQQIEQEAQHYVLRAPVKGPLADVAELRPGMMVRSGERLATILPGGDLKVMADFTLDAMGRVRPGQNASLRLDGFPSAQYGRVPASVLRVAQEPRAGKLRVELAIPSSSYYAAIPLQHGLLGTVEVEVERISPALLVLRVAGALLHNQPARGDQ